MNLVINSQFKPFSYQELIHPAMMATQMHQEMEAGLSELDAEASKWENLAKEETDPRAYSMYKQYADDLRKYSNDLAMNGLDYSTRKNLLNMKARFSREILPIQQAYAKREELANKQRDMYAQNGTFIFDRDMSKTSLDSFIQNPLLNFKAQDGSILLKQATNMASALAREINDGSNEREWRSILGNQYYETVAQNGITSEELMAFLAGNRGNPMIDAKLRNIVENTLSSTDIINWDNFNDVQDQVMSYINQGLYGAIGSTQWKELANQQQIAENRARAIGDPTDKAPKFRDYQIYSRRELSEREKDVADLLEDLEDPDNYTYNSNGERILTEHGKETSTVRTGEYLVNSEAALAGKLHSRTNDVPKTTNKFDKYRLEGEDDNQVYNRLLKEGAGIKDASVRAGYSFVVDDTNKELHRDLLLSGWSFRDTIPVVDFNPKQGRYVEVNAISKKDLLNGEWEPVQDIINPELFTNYSHGAEYVSKQTGESRILAFPKLSSGERTIIENRDKYSRQQLEVERLIKNVEEAVEKGEKIDKYVKNVSDIVKKYNPGIDLDGVSAEDIYRVLKYDILDMLSTKAYQFHSDIYRQIKVKESEQ